jgi:hypothetical protein
VQGTPAPSQGEKEVGKSGDKVTRKKSQITDSKTQTNRLQIQIPNDQNDLTKTESEVSPLPWNSNHLFENTDFGYWGFAWDLVLNPHPKDICKCYRSTIIQV